MKIPFNKPHLTGNELKYIKDAHEFGMLSGDGPYTKKAAKRLENILTSKKVLLTHSCTAGLEMMAILADFKRGDEFIVPSYTFVSTVNAFVLRGGVPVFVDIRDDTLNIDEKLIEKAITKKTKAIVPVHYAGVGCEMDRIMELAQKYRLLVLEDAAQGLLAKYKGQQLGCIGDMGAYSFHETKNIISGEGGAVSVNRETYFDRAEIIREKGTNRSKFFRGEVDKYTWVDIGSSYLPGEIIAAFLYAQLQEAERITKRRLAIWNTYHHELETLEQKGLIRRPIIPGHCEHNAHMYYILTNDSSTRQKLIAFLKEKGIHAVFHYIPLHSSPAGKKFSRHSGSMKITESIADRIIRLPFFYDLRDEEIDDIIDSINLFFKSS